jgi:hypothetical protein
MSLETGDYINDLNPSNPGVNDPKSQGDDHIRLIKEALTNSIAGFAGPVIVGGTDTGSANAYLLAADIPAYVANTVVVWKPSNANTGASTININSLGTRSIKQIDGTALAANDLTTGAYVAMVDTGSEYRLLTVTKNYVDQLAFSSVLPAQTDNAGKALITDGSTAAWGSTLTELTLGNPLAVTSGGTGTTDLTTLRTNMGAAASGANFDITSLNRLSTPLPVEQGGTGGNSGATARANIGAAKVGANSDISSLSALTTPLSIAQGGTGATTGTGAISSLLGWRPVQQGTGTGQNSNDVKIGWSVASSRLKATVDSTDLGNFVFQRGPYAAKAWGNFETSDATVNQSVNITSVVKNGTGDFTVTIADDMADANYHVSAIIKAGTNPVFTSIETMAAGTFAIRIWGTSGSASDGGAGAEISFAVFGNT